MLQLGSGPFQLGLAQLKKFQLKPITTKYHYEKVAYGITSQFFSKWNPISFDPIVVQIWICNLVSSPYISLVHTSA